MFRTSCLIALAAASALGACTPQKTPEQIAEEQRAAALQQAINGMANAFGANGAAGAQVDPQKLAAAMAQAGAMASAMDSNMTPEERAKMQAITGAIASGQVHPAASAWLAGANRAMAILGTVKDEASAAAAKAQLVPVYAEMAGPAATLKAMPEDQRDVAMGSAAPQLMAVGMNMMGLMAPLTSKPEVAKLVEDMLDQMPNFD